MMNIYRDPFWNLLPNAVWEAVMSSGKNLEVFDPLNVLSADLTFLTVPFKLFEL